MMPTPPLRTILVPLDGSALAELALPYAEALAKRAGAGLVLMRATPTALVLGMDRDESAVDAYGQAEAYLEAMAEQLEARGLVVEQALPDGEPVEWILDEVPLRYVDLIVMATHGRSGLGRVVYGSVAESVLARSPVPVLLVRAWTGEAGTAAAPVALADPTPRVLVPLDGSAFAETALPVAAALAQPLGAQIRLTSVVVPPTHATVANGVLVSYLDQEMATAEANARAYLEVTAQRLQQQAPGLAKPRIEVTVGDHVAAAIAETARRDQSLVVMATHGRTGLGRLVYGSVAGQVLRLGSTPLVLVRPGGMPAWNRLESTATAAQATPLVPT